VHARNLHFSHLDSHLGVRYHLPQLGHELVDVPSHLPDDRLLESVVAVVLDVDWKIAGGCAFEEEGNLLEWGEWGTVGFGKRDVLRGRVDAVTERLRLLGGSHDFLNVSGRKATRKTAELLSEEH